MDGVSWSATRSQELFSPPTPPADTLSRLASFIARADVKHQARSQRQPPSHLPKFVCQECDQGFPCASDLLQHQELKHSLPKPHRCRSCGQGFSLRSSLQLHRCSSSSTAPCKFGPRVSQSGPCRSTCTLHTSEFGKTQDKSLLHQPHMLDHSPYACAPCGRGFSQKQALLQHQQAGCCKPPYLPDVLHASGLPEDSLIHSEGDCVQSTCSDTPGPSCRAINMCRFCSRTFRTEAGLQRHKQTSHTEKRGLKIREDQLIKGNKPNRYPKSKPKSEAKVLSCRSCDMTFRSTAKLYVHRKEKHSREKNLQRESRPVVIKRRGGGVYPCQICSKVFVHHLSLRAHYRQHTTTNFTSITCRSIAEASRTQNSQLLLNPADQVQPSQSNNTGAPAGHRKPRKRPRAEDELDSSGSCGDGPEVEELDTEFPCPSCPEVFPLQWQLKEHVELHQSAVRRKQCSVCTSEMDNCKWPSSKRQRLYHCIPCQQGFSALDSFLEHCQEHLRVRVEEDGVAEGYLQPAGKA